MKRYPSKGFTIIELLVVVSIIALLVGILLPAIGKARQGAMLTQSISNIKQIGTSLVSYSAEYNDKHVTFVVDNLGAYGDGPDAFDNFATQTGDVHPRFWLGVDDGALWYYVPPEITNVPIEFTTGFGTFRVPNAMVLADYMNGKFYDPVYYAPKDSAVLAVVEPVFDLPSSFPGFDGPANVYPSSYCMSPAAMFNPAVFSRRGLTSQYFTDPYLMDAGFKAPTLAQAQYPDLKSWVSEHHWLQNRRFECNDHFGIGQGQFNGCEPYYFNHSILSNPPMLFFDNHIKTVGMQGAGQGSRRMVTQTGDDHHGLWSIDTPWGGDAGYPEGGGGGYFITQGFDWSATSIHILTIDGIRGRDMIAGSE